MVPLFFYSNSEPNPVKYHIRSLTVPYGMTKTRPVSVRCDSMTYCSFVYKVIICSICKWAPVYEENAQWSWLVMWSRTHATQSHRISQLPRPLRESAPHCLIRVTCPLYTVLNAVNSILWQTQYTTTSSSMLGPKYFCIHAPQKTSMMFHKS